MKRLLLSFTAVLGLAACTGPAPEVLATYDGGAVTVADLDELVRALPEARRQAPAGTSPDAWHEQLLRQLACQRLLSTAAPVRQRLASPELELGRRLATVSRLAAGVTAELVKSAPPSDEAVAAWRRKLTTEAPAPEPLSSFRHLFLRLDRAASAAERAAIRARAAELERRARAGEDFAALIREHSQSADAADGGLVENARPGFLEERASAAVASLEEGEISAVVETRTGLHVFKLERRIVPPARGRQGDFDSSAREFAAREALSAARRQLLTELHQRFTVETGALPWRVGEWTLSETELEQTLSGLAGDGEDQRQWLIEQLLLAEEGRRRGLLTAELEASVEEGLRSAAVQTVYQQRRAELLAGVPDQRLRLIYDAQPSRFSAPELAHLELIFVPQGRDSFVTQRRLEDRVAGLRAGDSFAELARHISTGPAAAEGGDLGLLPPPEWARLGAEIYRRVVTMETGEISVPIYLTDRIVTRDPRTLKGGFAILRVREKRPLRERRFEEAIDGVRAEYARQNAGDIDRQVRAVILDEAGFEIVRLPTAGEFLR